VERSWFLLLTLWLSRYNTGLVVASVTEQYNCYLLETVNGIVVWCFTTER